MDISIVQVTKTTLLARF